MKMIRKGILIAGLLTSAYLLGTCQAKTETIIFERWHRIFFGKIGGRL